MIHFFDIAVYTTEYRRRPTRKPVLWKGSRTFDAVAKFDRPTYRNLQRHRVVLPVIARFSCFRLQPSIAAASAASFWWCFNSTVVVASTNNDGHFRRACCW